MAQKLKPASRAKPHTPSPTARGPAVMGDNAQEETERIQLIAFVSKLSTADEAILVAQGPLKAAQTARRSVINLAKAAGFKINPFDDTGIGGGDRRPYRRRKVKPIMPFQRHTIIGDLPI